VKVSEILEFSNYKRLYKFQAEVIAEIAQENAKIKQQYD
jgi:hypothetical protein